MDFPFMHVEDFGSHEFRSLNGRDRVRFRWAPPHSVDGDAEASLVYPLGARFPVVRRNGQPRAGSFSVTAFTSGDWTAKLLDLLETETVVGLVHSRWVCEAKQCQIPEFQIVHVTGFPRETTAHTTIQTFQWELECVPVDPASIGPVVMWSWQDLDEDVTTWAQAQTDYGTWAGVEDGPQ